MHYHLQKWSPRGHILKSLALKVKFLALASRPQVLENCPVLSSRTAVFFALFKFCGAPEKFFGNVFFGRSPKNSFEHLSFLFFVDHLKKNFEDFFFGGQLRLCPWSLALASSIPVLGLMWVCPRKGCPWPRIFFVSLASSLVCSTPLLPFKPHLILSSWRHIIDWLQKSYLCTALCLLWCRAGLQKTWSPKKRGNQKKLRTPAELKNLEDKCGTFSHQSTSWHSITTKKTTTEEEQVSIGSLLQSADFTILLWMKHGRVRIRFFVTLLVPIAC